MSTVSEPSKTARRSVDHKSVDRLLFKTKAVYEPVLCGVQSKLPEPFRLMAGYHLGLTDADGQTLRGSGGKGLRPALVLASAHACGGRSAEVAYAATAVELVHAFTLVHDDVIDGDHTRRGRDTVWCRWGKTEAILLGDVLHAAAVAVVTEGVRADVVPAAVTRLAATIIELCRGQAEDCGFEDRPQVEIDEYIQMVQGKTGSLMGCASALGAICAGAEDQTVCAMDNFGRQIGLALQFVDDVLGIWGDPARTGKPVGNDIARRKLTLPVIAALSSGTGAAKDLAALYRSELPLTSEDIAGATALIEAAGGRQTAESLAGSQIDAAFTALPDVLFTPDLQALAHAATHRDR